MDLFIRPVFVTVSVVFFGCVYACVRACVCVCACARPCVCVCVCVRARAHTYTIWREKNRVTLERKSENRQACYCFVCGISVFVCRAVI